jgi:hypothetical protein
MRSAAYYRTRTLVRCLFYSAALLAAYLITLVASAAVMAIFAR